MRNAFKILFLILIGLIALKPLSAQVIAKLDFRGRCVNDSSMSVDQVNVYLFLARDSTLKKTTITDTSGTFMFYELSPDNYFIKCTHINYGTHIGPSVHLVADTSLTIKLAAKSAMLSEVIIKGEKQLIQNRGGKIVFNVNNLLIKSSFNSLELLNKAPGIALSKEDVLSLFGRSDILVTVNGRQIFSSQEDAVRYLKTVPAESIKTIEVTPNPGAGYENIYGGGIINIVLKPDESKGLKASAGTSQSMGEVYRGTGTLNFTYRTKRFIGTASLNLNRNTFFEVKKYNEQLLANNSNLFLEQNVRSLSTVKEGYSRLMGDYTLNKKSTIGFNFAATTAKRVADVETGSITKKSIGLPDSSIYADESRNISLNRVFGNVNFSCLLDSSGRKLTADLNFLNDNTNNHSLFYESFFDNNQQPIRNDFILEDRIPIKIAIVNLRSDYFHPFKKIYLFKAGWKFTKSTIDNDVRYDSIFPTKTVPDFNRTGNYFYKEFVSAAYVDLTRNFTRGNIEVGLRAEYAAVDGMFKTTNTSFERNYESVMPSASIFYKLNRKSDLSLSFRKLIVRPDYQKLNPFVQYVNQYLYIQGNPDLKQYNIFIYSLVYALKSKYIFTIRYDHTDNYIPQSTFARESPNSLVTKMTYDNIASSNAIQGSVYIPINITKWWEVYSNTNFFYIYTFSENPIYDGFNYKTTNVNTNITNVLMLPWSLYSELSIDVSTPLRINQTALKATSSINFSLRRSFLNNRLSIGIYAKDLAYQDLRRGTTYYKYTTSQFSERFDSRRVGFAIQYLFGKTKVQSFQRKSTGIEDEEGRIKK